MYFVALQQQWDLTLSVAKQRARRACDAKHAAVHSERGFDTSLYATPKAGGLHPAAEENHPTGAHTAGTTPCDTLDK